MRLGRPAFAVSALLLCAGLVGAADAMNPQGPRQLCARWAAEHSFPSGIAQERCRTDFPELAMDYGAYCKGLPAGETDALSLAACRAQDWRRQEPN